MKLLYYDPTRKRGKGVRGERKGGKRGEEGRKPRFLPN